MSKYIAITEQNGDIAVWKLRASTINDAVAEVRQELVGRIFHNDRGWHHDGGYWGERELSGVTIYEIARVVEMDVKKEYANMSHVLSEINQASEEENERRLYEALKVKSE